MQNFYEYNKYLEQSLPEYSLRLRKYFISIYILMGMALCVSAASALVIVKVAAFTNMIFQLTPYGQIDGLTGFGLLLSLLPISIALFFSFALHRVTTLTAQIIFWIYAILMGVSLSSLCMVYTEVSLVKTFCICASTFGMMSLYGYITKSNLTPIRSFLYMGIVGLIISIVANFFMQSLAIEFAISITGVLIFAGLVAVDTQMLKDMYYDEPSLHDKKVIIAALFLYLDIINLFVHLLYFFGQRKNKL